MPPSNSVGRLPSGLPGEFNSLRRDIDAARLAVAGTLPSGIKGNFNNIVPDAPDKYGSIGYTLICRAANDFSTVLGIFYDYANMSYTDELSAVGAGSVTFDTEDQSFLNQLVDAANPESILTRDNLWEVYFDGDRKFLWLGQSVNASELNEREDSTVTISGPGMASTLDWAKVLPNRFPDPRPKIDTLVDDFVDQDLDVYGKWAKSVSSIGAISVSDAKAFLSVNGTGSPGTYVATDYAYDFEDSGSSVMVKPYTGSSGTGYLKTHFRIEASDIAYVGIYVAKSGSSYVLTAEATGEGGAVVTASVPYTNNFGQRYWRIQEKDGTAIFSYKDQYATDDNWVVFASLPYQMDPTKVRLRLWVIGVAGTGMTYPQSSWFAQLSVNGVASALPPFERFRRLILKAQDRGTIRHIIPDWTSAADSMGAAWVDDVSAEAALGAGLLSVLGDYCESNRADWLFTSDYRLQIRQKVYVMDANTPDPTAPYHKEESVIFYAEESQLQRQKARSYREVANYLVGATSSGQYAVVTDQGSIANYQQREELVSDTTKATDLPSLETSLKNKLEVKKDGTISLTLQVAYDVEGKRLYEDFNLGDWVSVQTSSGLLPALESWRIVAVSVASAGEDDPQIELTLNAKLDPYWIKLTRAVEKTRWINPPSRVKMNLQITE